MHLDLKKYLQLVPSILPIAVFSESRLVVPPLVLSSLIKYNLRLTTHNQLARDEKSESEKSPSRGEVRLLKERNGGRGGDLIEKMH